MNTSDFGFWAMIAFWGIALGGISLGVSWARSKRKNPVPKELLIRSLEKRLESGEINREEYERRILRLSETNDKKTPGT